MDARSRQWAIAAGAVGIIVASSLIGAAVLARRNAEADIGRAPASQPPERVVSLAPSITEILFALGLGGRVVGVTRYCDYPPQAAAKPKIGGYYDPNYEVIVAQRPDLVVMLREHGQVLGRLDRLGVRTLQVSHNSVAAILDSVRRIGEACGAGERAAALAAEMTGRLGRVAERIAGSPRPSVLVSVGRRMGAGSVKDVWAASAGTIYHEVLELAGGRNALSEHHVKYASISHEGVMALDPEVIIDVIADLQERGLDEASIRGDWNALESVAAVRSGRVYVLGADYVEIPGPRVVRLVEDVAKILHPDLDWGAP